MPAAVVRWQVEAITIDSEGLALLGDISESTSLRHAVQVRISLPLPLGARAARLLENLQVLPGWQALLEATRQCSQR